MTPNQAKRLKADWSKIAGENVAIEEKGGTFYGFCSELGTLRLFKKYHLSAPRAAAGYSENLGEFYFRLEPLIG